MSFGYKISDSARTRPNTKQIVENLQFIEGTSNDEEVPALKKSPVLFDADGNTENCFVEIIQSEDIVPDEDMELGENGQYSIINVDPNITSCNEHHDMYLHKDKTLIKPGDKFDSHKSFRLYIDGNADRWKYYYSCADSRAKSSGKEFYTYRCVYSKPKCDYKPKGLRKRAETLKTNCPCRIVLKRLSYNSKYLTAVFVCDHHNHELTQESFLKLQHGRRLPPKLKEEVMGLLYLDVHPTVIRNYVQSVTGFILKMSYFNHVAKTMKNIDLEKTYTPDKLNMLYKKAEDLKKQYYNQNDDEDGLGETVKAKREHKKQDVEYFDVEPDNEVSYEVPGADEMQTLEESEPENKKSRLETCLQRLSYDDEVLQSVREMQTSVQGETQDNPWIKQEHFISANGDFHQFQEVNNQEASVAEFVDANQIVVMEAIGEGEENGGNPQHYILQKADDTENGEFTAYPCEVLYENDTTEIGNEEIVANEEVVPNEASENIVTAKQEVQPQEVPLETPNTSAQEQNNEENEPYNVRANPPPEFEYIHKFNIDEYMRQSWFPRYIEKVAEDSRASIADMLSDVYWGKSMFRLITTRGNGSKTIRISYLCEDVPVLDVVEDSKTGEYKYLASKHCKKVLSLKRKLADTANLVRHLNEVLSKVEKHNKELSYKIKLLMNTQGERNAGHNSRVYSSGTPGPNARVGPYSRLASTPNSSNKELDKTHINLRVKKQNLQKEISEYTSEIAQLEEVKKNLKRDICSFVSKKVLLTQTSGKQVDKLEEIKSTLARAIRRSNRDELASPSSLK